MMNDYKKKSGNNNKVENTFKYQNNKSNKLNAELNSMNIVSENINFYNFNNNNQILRKFSTNTLSYSKEVDIELCNLPSSHISLSELNYLPNKTSLTSQRLRILEEINNELDSLKSHLNKTFVSFNLSASNSIIKESIYYNSLIFKQTIRFFFQDTIT